MLSSFFLSLNFFNLSLILSLITIIFFIFAFLYRKVRGRYYVLPIYDNYVDLSDRDVIGLFICFLIPVLNFLALLLFSIIALYILLNRLSDVIIKILHKHL